MTDSRDKPEFETLSYRSKECPAKPSSAPMGFNSIVIKPETRVNKAEDAGQHLQESLCRETEPDQPNQNLMIIEEIEGLFSQVNDKLYKLSGGQPVLMKCTVTITSKAIEEIDLFQKTTLFELRKAFE